MKTTVNLGKSCLNLFLAVSAIIVLVPFYWMVNTSLKSAAEVVMIPPTLFPRHVRWSNYVEVIIHAPLIGYLTNTIIVGVSVIVVGTAVTVLSAFAFARLHFRGKNLLFFAVLATMMIPQEMLIVTNFQTIAQWGWMNTLQALVIPYWINPFNIYLLRQTFLQIPNELYLAAKVDGLSNFGFLSKILLPMSWSTIITTMILSLILIWHTFAWPNLVTTKDTLRLVSNGLQNSFTSSVGNIEYELQMAAATLITVPLIILFLLLRNMIFSGLMHGGVKG